VLVNILVAMQLFRIFLFRELIQAATAEKDPEHHGDNAAITLHDLEDAVSGIEHGVERGIDRTIQGSKRAVAGIERGIDRALHGSSHGADGKGKHKELAADSQ
jgi:hypothetical protein